jgi:hypothetical protein
VERIVLKGSFQSQNMFIVCAQCLMSATCTLWLENNVSNWEVEMNITSSLTEEEQKNQMKRQIFSAPHISTKGMLYSEFSYIRTKQKITILFSVGLPKFCDFWVCWMKSIKKHYVTREENYQWLIITHGPDETRSSPRNFEGSISQSF